MKRLIIAFALFAAASLGMNAGKTWQYKPSVSILGDSYSTFEGYVDPATNEMWYTVEDKEKRTDVHDVTQTWWWMFIKENGFRLEQNNSYSGSTISYLGYNQANYQPRSFITRVDDLGTPDILLVFGGTNDSWANVPAGEFKASGESTDMDLYTFCPAVMRLMKEITVRYPNVDVYFIINTELRPEIVESIETACGKYGVPVIRLHDIDKKNGHPSVAGMKAIAAQLKEAIVEK
jgi:hypothetical protein